MLSHVSFLLFVVDCDVLCNANLDLDFRKKGDR
jgi:hypothetical protein